MRSVFGGYRVVCRWAGSLSKGSTRGTSSFTSCTIRGEPQEHWCPLDSSVGFIYCAKIQMSRPGRHDSIQRSVASSGSCYSDHKRFHCLIYSTLTTPDGLSFYLHGPEVGRGHDPTLLHDSGLQGRLQACLNVDGRQFYLYGDAAYMLCPWLQVELPRGDADVEQVDHNTRMSAVRVAVEWNYKYLKQLWSFKDFPRALEVHQGPIGLIYTASALLKIFKTCMEGGGQLQAYFMSPPQSWPST